MFRRLQRCIVASILAAAPAVYASGPSFHPDFTLAGDSLKGWTMFGGATWTTADGEVHGAPQGGRGGWLLLDHSLQDVNFYAEFRCAAGCDAGVLLRAQKSPDGGMKGIYVSLSDPDTGEYAVTIDSAGQITDRSRLPRGGGLIRVAPTPSPETDAAARRLQGYRPPTPPADLPLFPPDTKLRTGDWNSIEVFIDANIIRAVLNNGREVGAVGDSDGYGPVALYVGGSGPVEFKNVAVGDMGLKVSEPEKVSPDFRKQRLSDFYYSWEAAAADFNHEGNMDVVSGPYIYYGPDYLKSREIWLAQATDPTTSFAGDANMEYAADFTGDGWADVITVNYGTGDGAGVFLYVNPKGENRRWEKFKVVDAVQSEIAVVRDVDGDGKPAVVYCGEGYVRYAKPDPSNPTGKWIVQNVSEKGYAAAHGIGVGDINGDGRLDILNPYGWWEHPAPGSNPESWKYHPTAFAKYTRGIFGGSVMAVYDVNGDGLNDVVTALDAHGWGLAWFEQKRDPKGNISFVEHMIMDDFSTRNAGGVTFSELHGSTYADVDGDGIPDFIVGKRYFSHLDTNIDPYPRGPAVLYWYQTVRNPHAPGGAEFIPHLIDNHSGAGSNVLAVDLKHDGAMDIVTATRFGTFIYWGKPRPKEHAGTAAGPAK